MDQSRSFRFRPSKRLNTKEFCFFCLQTAVKNEGISDCQEERNDNATIPIPLGSLQHNLKINLDNFCTNNESELQGRDIEASLCTVCKHLVTKYSFLVQQLEKVQMEMDFYRERIKLRISQAAKNPELVANYSKKMTSDPETLVQLAFIDKLRKEFSIKASERLTSQPIVKLTRTEVSVSAIQVVKMEPFEECETGFPSEDPPSPVSSSSSNDSPFTIINIQEKASRQRSAIYSRNDQTGTFHCSRCGEKYLHKSSVLRHYAIVHLKKRFKCNICNVAIFLRQDILSKHKKRCRLQRKREAGSTSPAPVENPAPKRIRKSLYFLKDSQTGIYKCKKCGKEYRNTTSCSRHYKIIHLKQRYKCDICKTAIYTRRKSLIHHRRFCQQRLEKRLSNEKNPAFTFICEFCKKRFDSKGKLSCHRFSVHKSIDRYSCDLCDKKFKQKNALKKHKDSVHLGKTFSCRFCNNSYKWLTDTRKHEKKCKLQQKIKSELNE